MTPTNNHADAPTLAPVRTAPEAPAEVREFLQQIKGKDPDELLGTNAQGSLSLAMIQATIITVVVMIASTFGPYVWSMVAPAHKHDDKKPDTDVKVETPDPVKPAATPTMPATAPTVAPATADKNRPTTNKEFIDKIGANDVKPANPKVNPLDKSTDDLFKDLDKK